MKTTGIILETHRFIMDQQVIDLLMNFTREHQWCERKEFKAAWAKWITNENIKPILAKEEERLEENGFKGDVLKKMFESVRYYYLKKLHKEQQEEGKCEVKRIRKEYEALDKDIIEMMDRYIKVDISNTDENNVCKISPAASFTNFCRDHKELFMEEINRRKTEDSVSNEDVKDVVEKLKKTYKNKFYKVRTSL